MIKPLFQRPSPSLLRKSTLVVLALVVGFLFFGAFLELYEKWGQLETSRQKITALENRLARPTSPNPYSAYSNFISHKKQASSSSLQNELIELISSLDGHITDIRELASGKGVPSAQEIRYQIVFEGDLQAVSDILHRLDEFSRPLLITSISIGTISPTTEPDRHMRASLETIQWLEDPS